MNPDDPRLAATLERRERERLRRPPHDPVIASWAGEWTPDLWLVCDACGLRVERLEDGSLEHVTDNPAQPGGSVRP